MLLVRRVKHIFLVAVMIGLFSPPIGLYLAFAFDLPSSPAIVAVAAIVLAFSWLVNIIRSR
jgi:ABC-type Mn2+/Zn2+ transport system permease subunit